MGTAGYLITNIFRVYLIYRFYNIFFTQYKINKKYVFFIYLIYYVINSVVYIQICIPVVTLAVNIVSLMAVTYIYQATFRKRMFYVMVQLGLSICTEAIAVLVSVNVMPELTSQNMEDYTMIQYFIANISCFPIVLGTEKIKRTGQGEEIPGMYWVLLLLLPVFSIYIAAVLCMLPEKYNLIAGVSFVLLLLMNLIVFYLYDVLSQFMAEKIKENKIEEQNRNYEQQLYRYEELFENTRALRHDLKNHFGVIYLLAEQNQDKEVINYVQRFLDMSDNGGYRISTGNVSLDALISYKYEEAKRQGICINTEVAIAKNTRWNDVDLCTITGNLLDNAIRAAKDIENASIEFVMRQHENKMVIKVKNPYRGVLKRREDVFETTKQNKNRHGIGLEHIKKIVEQYHGVIDFDTQNGEFVVRLILY